MFARTTLLEIDTLRISIDDALATFEQQVVPRLRDQPGFLGVYALSNPEGQAMLISFWETAAEAEASGASGFYPDLLQEFVTFFRSPPGREHYEVRLAMPPAIPPAMHPAGT